MSDGIDHNNKNYALRMKMLLFGDLRSECYHSNGTVVGKRN